MVDELIMREWANGYTMSYECVCEACNGWYMHDEILCDEGTIDEHFSVFQIPGI